MTAEQIALVAGAVLAILFEYVPGLSNWYEKGTPQEKRLVMLGVMFLVVAGAFGLSCAGLLKVFVCTYAGAWEALLALVLAIAGNQATHLLVKKTGSAEALEY